MTCAVWPSSLPPPEIPFSGNYAFPLAVSSKNEIGAIESKRKQSVGVYTGRLNLRLDNQADLITFTNFWRRTLYDGLKPFDARWIFTLGYNGYQAKILDYNTTSQGAHIIVKMDLILVQVVKDLVDPSVWFNDNVIDNDFDLDAINGPSCAGYSGHTDTIGNTPTLQNGGSYSGSHNKSVSDATHSPPWDASAEHKIFGHTEVAGTISATPDRPTLFGSNAKTYAHKGSIVPLPIASGATSSGFGDDTIVDPTSVLGIEPLKRTYVDNGCAEFEFVANLAIRPSGVDAYIDVTIQILGASGNLLYEKVFPRHSGNLGNWTAISDSGAVPAGARFCRYILFFDKNNYGGASTYAFVNNMRMAWNLPIYGP